MGLEPLLFSAICEDFLLMGWWCSRNLVLTILHLGGALISAEELVDTVIYIP